VSRFNLLPSKLLSWKYGHLFINVIFSSSQKTRREFSCPLVCPTGGIDPVQVERKIRKTHEEPKKRMGRRIKRRKKYNL